MPASRISIPSRSGDGIGSLSVAMHAISASSPCSSSTAPAAAALAWPAKPASHEWTASRRRSPSATGTPPISSNCVSSAP